MVERFSTIPGGEPDRSTEGLRTFSAVLFVVQYPPKPTLWSNLDIP